MGAQVPRPRNTTYGTHQQESNRALAWRLHGLTRYMPTEPPLTSGAASQDATRRAASQGLSYQASLSLIPSTNKGGGGRLLGQTRSQGGQMSNRRKAKPNRISGYIDGVPHSQMSSPDADKFQQRVKAAPMLDIPTLKSKGERGRVLHVDKLGSLGDGAAFFNNTGALYVETTDADIYRLPPELAPWATDLISYVVANGGRKSGMFPTDIEFGMLDGRIYAELL